MDLRKKLLLTFLAALSQIIAWGQTNVEGGIFVPTTWDLAGSPYIVLDDIVVFPDASLTIEPGVVIKFTSGKRLELRAGDLIANGTLENPILFTLDSADPANDTKWLGIENTADSFDSINVELSHVVFEYAETAINYGAGYAIRNISDAVFQYNDRAIFDGALGYNWIEIFNSQFLENTIGVEGRMSVYDCVFDLNDFAIANPLSFQNSSQGGRVIGCTFTNNGKAISSIGQVITFAWIDSTTFTNNDEAVTLYWAEMSNSVVEGSTVSGAYLNKGVVQNNIFIDNNIGFRVTQTPYELEVYNNTFNNNTIALQVDGAGAPIYENSLCGSTDYDAYINTASPVDLKNNCWCTTDPAQIELAIYDAFDDVSSGIASYDPFSVNCIEGLVFPGDANSDGAVNANDLLMMGLGYGINGPERPNAQTLWVGQEAPDWPTTFPNNLNQKHADANGDGIINMLDVDQISQHYGSTHNAATNITPVWENTNTYPLFLEGPAIINPGDVVTLDLHLGDDIQQLEDLYGISLSIFFNPELIVPGSFQVDVSESWLGNAGSDLLTMSQEIINAGKLDLALVRNNQIGQDGGGKIASIQFIMVEDLIVFYNGPELGGMDELEFTIESVQAITPNFTNLQIEADAQQFLINSDFEPNQSIDQFIQVYPNPVQEQLFIQNNGIKIESAQVLHLDGRSKLFIEAPDTVLSLNYLEPGMYWLRLETEYGSVCKKIVVQE